MGATRRNASRTWPTAGISGSMPRCVSITTVLGFPGGVYANGTGFITWFLGYILLAFVVGYFINPLIWRAGRIHGAITLPDLFRRRIDGQAFQKVVNHVVADAKSVFVGAQRCERFQVCRGRLHHQVLGRAQCQTDGADPALGQARQRQDVGRAIAVLGEETHQGLGRMIGADDQAGGGAGNRVLGHHAHAGLDVADVEVLGLKWGHDDHEIRRKIGISLQETRLSDKLTVRETVTLFRSFYPAGPTPEEAIARMNRALREFRIRGVQTNLAFLENIITHPDFVTNRYTTRFIDTTPELFEFKRRRDRPRLRPAGRSGRPCRLPRRRRRSRRRATSPRRR